MRNAIKQVKPISDRFFSKIVKGLRCWRWIGAKNERGYGVLNKGRRGARLTKAHRVSWEIHVGRIPQGMSVAHRCNNPECCNPRHLYLATHAENMRDAARDGLLKQSRASIEKRAAKIRGVRLTKEHKEKLRIARRRWWQKLKPKDRAEFCAMRGAGLKKAWAEGRR